MSAENSIRVVQSQLETAGFRVFSEPKDTPRNGKEGILSLADIEFTDEVTTGGERLTNLTLLLELGIPSTNIDDIGAEIEVAKIVDGVRASLTLPDGWDLLRLSSASIATNNDNRVIQCSIIASRFL